MSETEKTKFMEWVIRIFIAVSLLSIGLFRHLYGLEESTGSLMESGLSNSSIFALIEVHALTLVEIVLLVWTIGGRFSKAYLVGTSVLFVVYSLSFFLSLGNESYLNSDLSSINGNNGYWLVLALVVFTFYAHLKRRGFEKRVGSGFQIAICSTLLIGYFGYYSGSINQYRDLGSEYAVKYAKWDKYWEEVDQQQPQFQDISEYVICFFSTSCSHCNEAARRLGVYQKKYNVDVLAVFFAKSADGEFWESDQRVNEFLERNHINIPFIKMVDYEAVSIADNHFPVIVTMKNGKPRSIYIGDELNAWAFDHLFID